MPAKKTRKRAYIPPSSEVVNKREPSQARTVRPSAGSGQRAGAGARGTYVYPTPSIGRTLRRLPIYFIMILALQYFLNPQKLDGSERILASAAAAGVVTLIFAPFMHLMDRFAYNRYQKRQAAAQRPKG